MNTTLGPSRDRREAPSGIGEATARGLAANGHRLALLARRIENAAQATKLAAVVENLGAAGYQGQARHRHVRGLKAVKPFVA